MTKELLAQVLWINPWNEYIPCARTKVIDEKASVIDLTQIRVEADLRTIGLYLRAVDWYPFIEDLSLLTRIRTNIILE